MRTQSDLRRAIDEDQLVLHYQPIVAADTRAVLGFETLVRWEHPERGLLSPAEFIDVAEESGLIVPLGAAVLAKGCAQLATWRAAVAGQRPAPRRERLRGPVQPPVVRADRRLGARGDRARPG